MIPDSDKCETMKSFSVHGYMCVDKEFGVDDMGFLEEHALDEPCALSTSMMGCFNVGHRFDAKENRVLEVLAVPVEPSKELSTPRNRLVWVNRVKKLRVVPVGELMDDANKGGGNFGVENEGDNNFGSFNAGNNNHGDRNVGNNNYGSGNYGDGNHGHDNMGNFNLGNNNVGSFNMGSSLKGMFNTNNNGDKIEYRMFDKRVSIEEFKMWAEAKSMRSLFKAKQLSDITPDVWCEIATIPNFDFEKFKVVFNACNSANRRTK